MNCIGDIICRLCLKFTNNDYERIALDTKHMLNFIQLEINFSITEEPVMCKDCEKTLQEVFAFKLQLSQTEDNLISFSTNLSDNSFDLKQFYSNENEKGDIIGNTDCDICRFCAQSIEKDCCVSLEMIKENVTLEKDLLLKCITENVEATMYNKKPSVCTICIASLKKYLKFIKTCLDVEGKIEEYCKVEGTNSKDQIELYDLLNFTTKSMVRDDNKLIKPKDLYENERNVGNMIDITNVDPTQFVKDETPVGVKGINMEIKLEESNDILTNLKEEELDIKDEQMPLNEKQDDSNSVQDPQDVSFTCDVCAYITYRKDHLRNHVKTHMDPSLRVMFNCKVCPYKGSGKRKLAIHMLKHKDPSELKRYKCERCTYEVNDKAKLRQHMRMSPKTGKYKCDTCPYQAKATSLQKRHELKHKDLTWVSMYECAHCDFKTKRKANLKVHTVVHQKPSELKMYKCEICPYEAKLKLRLMNHMMIHKGPAGVKLYKCDQCGFQTKMKWYLKCHEMIHKDCSEVILYKCDKCPYEGKWKHNLKKHLETHKAPSERKVYKCDVCGFKTKDNCKLGHHNMVVHNDLSRVNSMVYKCEYCPYKTKRRWYLTNHMTTCRDSLAAAVYKCEECNVVLKNKQGFTRHMILHKDPSEVTMHKCELCSYEAKIKHYLTRHKKIHGAWGEGNSD